MRARFWTSRFPPSASIKHDEHDRGGTVALIAPAVPRFLLNHQIARGQLHRLAIVELQRQFTVKHQGKDVMTVNQRIGWDPAAKQIRSWEFDSEGGFGEGKWGGDGDRWVIKHTAIRPEGTSIPNI